MKHLFQAIFGGLIDTARATTHLGAVSTSEGQIDAEHHVVVRWNREAKKAGWDVRLERFGPNLPDVLYNWDRRDFIQGRSPGSGRCPRAAKERASEAFATNACWLPRETSRG